MTLDLRDLTYFETIAETNTYEEASELVGLTKQALTKSVRRLEEDLGGMLFLRDGRGKVLTPLGDILLRRARQLRLNVGDIEREIREHASGAAGVIRIGAENGPVETLLSDVFRHLQEKAPGVQVELSIAGPEALHDRLRRSELDLAVSLFLADDHCEFDARMLFSDDVVVAAGRTHPLAGRPAGLADLAVQDWVLPPRSVPARAWLDRVFTSRGISPPRPRIEADSTAMLQRAVEDLHLLTFTGRHRLNGLTELPNPLTTMHREFAVMTRKGAYLPPAAQTLRGLLLASVTGPAAQLLAG